MPKQDVTSVIRSMNRLYDLLADHPEGMSVEEMSQLLDIPKPTVYRYLKDLSAIGGEGCLKKRSNRYALASTATRRLQLTPQQGISLAIARQLFKQIEIPHHDAFEALYKKLAPGGYREIEADYHHTREQVERTIAFSEPVLCRPPKSPRLFTQLFDHCLETPRRFLQVQYLSKSSPGQTHRRLLPLALIFHHTWYLVGLDAQKSPAVRVYAVDRIRAIVPEDCFGDEKWSAFEVQDFIQRAWRLIRGDAPNPTRVVLRMPDDLAFTHKHPSQNVLGPMKGGQRVEFWVGAPEEMVPFILSHSPRVEVLEPASLREKVVQRLRETLEVYAAGAPAPDEAR